MNEHLQQLQLHPKHKTILANEIKKSIDFYRDNSICKDELSHIIKHYADHYGYLLFQQDYEVNTRIKYILGNRRLKIMFEVLEPQQLYFY
ncbi:uncharacterized protein (TIGR04540 family) [Breznakia blatticola]|uniref:Uncharacterized protein (TIGR04540 family) n=1 Tax=Breznakia blatticola TaxID=1754012 RepID=A0A4R7Z876_9FIRM|nr:hypothetical protein [Breznakia blatticola]TDW08038.1 uncharacterized protein (TIGR04540 family) [Breznakia blatticola]